MRFSFGPGRSSHRRGHSSSRCPRRCSCSRPQAKVTRETHHCHASSRPAKYCTIYNRVMLHSRLAGMMPWTLLRHNNQRTNPAALNMARIGRMWKIGIVQAFASWRRVRNLEINQKQGLVRLWYTTKGRGPSSPKQGRTSNMLHQLIFSKLLGEIDYGAMGDFNPAG